MMQPLLMRARAVLAVVGVLLHCSAAHVVDVGRCKNVASVSNFQPAQFAGVWYVIEIFSTTSDCMTMTFNQTENGFTVTEARELYLATMVQLDHTLTNTGYLTVPNSNNPAKMKVRWPSNFLGSPDFTVVDTDYSNFALIFECQPLLIVNRHSAAILSRQNTLTDDVIERVKGDLATSGLDPTDFDMIDHRSCNKVGEADFNWSIDEDTFASDFDYPLGNNTGEILDFQIPNGDAVDFFADPTLNEVP